MPLKELTGQKFGRLTVVRLIGRLASVSGHRKTWWHCSCDCGEVSDVVGQSLTSGNTRSCGCLEKEARGAMSVTHGLSHTPEFRVWCTMLARCANPKSDQWVNYGGRGIMVCEQWARDFGAFYAHLGPRPSNRHSIDRFPDNDGNYEPGNVRWATSKEQRLNQRQLSACKRGHPFSPDNTAIRSRPEGGTFRRCLTCEREALRKRRALFGRSDRRSK